MKKYLVSTATLPMAVGKKFFDYTGIFEAYNMLDVNGVELVFLPEWNKNHAPLTKTSADWNNTPKIDTQELVDLIQDYEIYILIVMLVICCPQIKKILF